MRLGSECLTSGFRSGRKPESRTQCQRSRCSRGSPWSFHLIPTAVFLWHYSRPTPTAQSWSSTSITSSRWWTRRIKNGGKKPSSCWIMLLTTAPKWWWSSMSCTSCRWCLPHLTAMQLRRWSWCLRISREPTSTQSNCRWVRGKYSNWVFLLQSIDNCYLTLFLLL